MSTFLKTGGLLTALLGTAALDAALSQSATAEPIAEPPSNLFPAPQPITVSPTPQPLIPVPMAVPTIEHSGHRESAPQPVGNADRADQADQADQAEAPAVSLPLTTTAIELEVEPAPQAAAAAAAPPPPPETIPLIMQATPNRPATGQNWAIAIEALSLTSPPQAIARLQDDAPASNEGLDAAGTDEGQADEGQLDAAKIDAAGIGVARVDAAQADAAGVDEGQAEAAQINAAQNDVQISAARIDAARTDIAVEAAPSAPSQKSNLLAAAPETTSLAHSERRGWFDDQLAQTIARRKGQREAKLRENLLRTAQRYVQQNNIAAAQQIAQNPVFLDAERTALQQAIARRQRPVATASGPKAEPQTPLAADIARLAARQAWLLERLPAAASCQQAAATTCDSPAELTSYHWLMEAANQGTIAPVGSMPLAVTAPISSRYGWRIHPIYGDRRFHAGVDFAAPMGTPVYASVTGYVETSEHLSGYGYTVILESRAAQERHLYAHLSDMAVRPGQWVTQGELVGWVGSTGNSTGPHLHFEIHRRGQTDWVTIDPLSIAAQ